MDDFDARRERDRRYREKQYARDIGTSIDGTVRERHRLLTELLIAPQCPHPSVQELADAHESLKGDIADCLSQRYMPDGTLGVELKSGVKPKRIVDMFRLQNFNYVLLDLYSILAGKQRRPGLKVVHPELRNILIEPGDPLKTYQKWSDHTANDAKQHKSTALQTLLVQFPRLFRKNPEMFVHNLVYGKACFINSLSYTSGYSLEGTDITFPANGSERILVVLKMLAGHNSDDVRRVLDTL